MKKIFSILFVLPFFVDAQMFFVNNKNIFNFNSQVWSSVINVGTHSGTTLVEGKKFSNTNEGTNFGSAIAVLGGGGKYEVKNCSFMQTAGEAIQFENFGTGPTDTIWIHDNFFGNNKNGIYVFGGSATVIIEYNQGLNPHGARGGRGQFYQGNSTTNQPGSAIRYNRIKGYSGEIYSEDLISSFNTSGTAASPFRIYKNIAEGGGPSASGGGFITGDADGVYVTIESNIFKNVGNYVQALAGGGNLVSRNNIGFQRLWSYSNNIGQYTYITNASTFCNNITMTNNRIGLQKLLNYYCYCVPTCGDVIGINESEGDPNNGWRATNFDNVTIDTINRYIPSNMITYLPEDDLWKVRDSSTLFRWATGGPGWISPGANGAWPPSPDRPTANAGADQSISINNATLTGSGGNTYRWVQVSGPNQAVVTSPASASTTVTGLINGTYVFRLEAYEADDGTTDGTADGASDADWMSITVALI